MATPTTTTAEEGAFRSLYIHTHDVSRSLKPSADGELAHAIHQTLHFALDGHPDDYTPASPNSGAGSGCDPLATMPTSTTAATDNSATASTSTSTASGSREAEAVKKGFFPTGDAERPYISYHWDTRTKTLALPNPSTISNPIADPCSPDHRSSYDITAKFFFLDPNDISPELVEDALKRLTSTTGIITVDTLVLSFPTLDLDSRSHAHLSTADSTATGAEATWLNKVKDVWQAVSMNPQLISLGLSDFSASSLDHLLSSFNPPIQPPSTPLFSPAIPLSSNITDASAATASTAHPETASSDVASANVITQLHAAQQDGAGVGSFWNMEYSIVSSARRPRLVSINVKQDPCAFDREFSQYCTNMGIQLVAHSDRKDVLPQRTLPGLMEEFKGKLPINAEGGRASKPKWALKYTTLIRDRGVFGRQRVYCIRSNRIEGNFNVINTNANAQERAQRMYCSLCYD